MKRFILILAVFSLVLPLFGQEKSSPFKDQKDKVSYSLGLNIGFNLGRQNVSINPDALVAGIKDAIAGKPQLTPDQIKETTKIYTLALHDALPSHQDDDAWRLVRGHSDRIRAGHGIGAAQSARHHH